MPLPQQQQRLALVHRMLEFFTSPRPSLRLHLQPEFQDYTPAEVRAMLYALDRVGLIANANAKQTRGSIYHITTRGRWLLQMKQP